MNISVEDRLYGLSLLWKVAEYNFAYWEELTELDWDKTYREYIPKVIAAEDPYSYYCELIKFISLLKDGHTYVAMPEEIKPLYNIPITTTYIQGKHLLSSVPEGEELYLYSEILAINDTKLNEYLKNYVYPYTWHEKKDSCFYYGILGYMINCHENDQIRITTDKGSFSIDKGKEIDTIESKELIHHEISTMTTLFESSALSIKRTIDDIIYMTIHTFATDKLKKQIYNNIDIFDGCKGFIIDVRDNTGGSDQNVNAVVQLFYKDSFKQAPSNTPMNLASYKAYGQYKNIDKLDLNDEWQKRIYDVCKHRLYYIDEIEYIMVKDSPVYFEQPVVILAGCNTASAAESFLIKMKYKDRATIIGSRSYGSNGQPYLGKLPGGGSFGINTMRCFDLEGISYNNIGIEPDIYVENSIDNYINGFDNIFDKGLRNIREIIREIWYN